MCGFCCLALRVPGSILWSLHSLTTNLVSELSASLATWKSQQKFTPFKMHGGVPTVTQQKRIEEYPWGRRFNPWPHSHLVGRGSGVAVSCIGRRFGSDPVLLWLWCRPAAIDLIQPLAVELPYAEGEALKRKKKKKRLRKQNKMHGDWSHSKQTFRFLFWFFFFLSFCLF